VVGFGIFRTCKHGILFPIQLALGMAFFVVFLVRS